MQILKLIVKTYLPQGTPPWFMAAAPVSRYKTGPRPIPLPQTADLSGLLWYVIDIYSTQYNLIIH